MLLACYYKPRAIFVFLQMVRYEQRTSISIGLMTVVAGHPYSKSVLGALLVVGERTSPSEERESSTWSELSGG